MTIPSTTVNDTLAADIRRANLQASAWRYFDPARKPPRRQSRLAVFILILVIVATLLAFASELIPEINKVLP